MFLVQGDYIDEVVAEWNKEMPGLDTSGLEIGGRIVVLDKHLERRIDRYLADHDLQIWGFDVLSSLLRSGAPYQQTPKQLMRNCFLSSGAVSNRLKRLEARGLIYRIASESDKRSHIAALTEEGLELARKTIKGRVEFMKITYGGLSAKEQTQLVGLLNKLLLYVQELEEWE